MRESDKTTYEERERQRRRLLREAKEQDKVQNREPEKKKTSDTRTTSQTKKPRIKEVVVEEEDSKMDKFVNLFQRNAYKKKKGKRNLNKEFARITYAFVGLFLCMMGYIVYYQIVQSDDVINSTYNTRQDLLAANVVRGSILDTNGNVLAETLVSEDGSETRNYPYGSVFAHAVGYSVLGKSGIELTENFNLLTSNAFFGEKIINEFQDTKDMGDNVVTTLDADLQQVAYDALSGYNGAAIVIEPDTGKILAMVSRSSYDPNTISEDWDTLTSDSDSSLLNRATQSQIVPGSVFKIVTALEYIRENEDYEDYTYTCTGTIEQDGTTIQCSNQTAHGTQTLEEAFANSCNCAFIDMGLHMDIDSLAETADEMLFNTTLPGDVTSNSASFVLDSSSSTAEIMMTVMGQGDTLTSPYQMALVTCAIANGGKLMTPYIVDSIENYTGSVNTKYSPIAYDNIMTSSEAAQLSEYMEAVVEYGTGTTLSGQSYTAAGKTGTAEYSSDKSQSHSWFTGFTNVDNPDIVVSVVIEQADGEIRAINVAKQIMDAYYN